MKTIDMTPTWGEIGLLTWRLIVSQEIPALRAYRSEIARPTFAPLLGTAECLVLKQRQGRRDVRAWMKSRLANMRFESAEAPEGYDETITADNESAGQAANAGNDGSGAAGVRTRSQPRPLSAVSGGR